jgi:sugar phosphate isomerase/epimerase
MNRREFTKNMGVVMTALNLPIWKKTVSAKPFVRLGAPLLERFDGPDEWIALLKKDRYRAAYCPLKTDAPADQIKAYQTAAKRADIVIAEVGAWSNPISPDADMARTAIKKCIDSLALSEAIGANCCVNISGSKNPAQWAGPHKDNFSTATFDQIVEVTRRIIDEVKPTQTYFALELMPWSYPDSPDSYLRLIKAIDRKRFAVHLDPMNIIDSPRSFFSNSALIKDCFAKLGPYIRSCHGKDIILKEDVYTPQLVECRPGLGQLDYTMFLTELSKLKNIPLMLEHLSTTEAYQQAATYIRSVGDKVGIDV